MRIIFRGYDKYSYSYYGKIPRDDKRYRFDSEGIKIAVIMAAFMILTAFALAGGIDSSIEEEEAPVQEELLAILHSEHDITLDIPEEEEPVENEAAEIIEKEEELSDESPDRLNAAYFFDEGADISDALNSYAGKVFRELLSENAGIYSSFYDLSHKTPLSISEMLGSGREYVLAGFNPYDPSHDASDPDTWIISSFDNVHVDFYDGDGSRINGYYAVQEILSMASVYQYFHDDTSYEGLSSYCQSLFGLAVTYKMHLGEIYYDTGCLNEASGEEDDDSEGFGLHTQAEDGYEYSVSDTSADALSDTGTYISGDSVPAAGTVSAASSAESSSSETESAGYAVFSSSNDMFGPGDAVPAEEYGSSGGTDDAQEDSVSAVSTDKNTDYSTAVTGTIAPQTHADNGNVYTEETGAGVSSVYGAGYEEDTVTDDADEQAEDTLSGTDKLLLSAGIDEMAEEYCPGHIDLYITVTIHGMDDHRNSLFDIDSIGSDETSFTDKWQGWSDEMKSYALSLSSKDWSEEYGLNMASASLPDALTASEIDEYLSMLPEGTTETRRNIIKFALESVGRVPYYWGGKPSSPGYDGNGFFEITAPDNEGRILKGLDCSGWIRWVYWSATGNDIPVQSTSGLVSEGRPVQRSELEPGDLIIRTGDDSHVVMFLCWDGGGQFIGIHENAGSINVSVSIMTADWPYYRSFL